MKKILFFGVVSIVLIIICESVYGSDINTDKTAVESTVEQFGEYMLERIDVEEIEKYSNEYLPDKMTFSEVMNSFMAGDMSFEKNICSYIYEMFFYEIDSIRPLIINVFFYAIIFMVISRLIFWKKDYVYNISFMFMYASIEVMLFPAFLVTKGVIIDSVNALLAYLTALAPAYAAVLTISGNGFSAAGFYVFTFVLIYIVEWLIKIILIPAIHLFLVLEIVNHIYEEEKFGKLSELIEVFIKKTMKTSIKIVAGIGIVQAVIAPAKDRISESLILKSFSAIPGIGQIGQGAGEIMLGCAMLIKNSVGAAALVVLGAIVITPLVKALIFSVMYRLLSAILQPLSDKRIVEGIESVARAGNLYYIVLRDASILFFIVIAIVCASTSFIK